MGGAGGAGGHDTHAGRRRAAAKVVTAQRPTAPVPSSAVYKEHPLCSTNPPVSVSLASTGRPGLQRRGSGAGRSLCRRRTDNTAVERDCVRETRHVSPFETQLKIATDRTGRR